MNSKSREIRRYFIQCQLYLLILQCSSPVFRAVCDFLAMLMANWETSELERNATALQEAVRQGLHDADPEARSFSRKVELHVITTKRFSR